MANFDFSNFLKSIAAPVVSVTPEPPLFQTMEGEESRKSIPAESSAEKFEGGASGGVDGAVTSDSSPGQSREWLVSTKEEKRGGIATRLPMERNVRVDVSSYGGDVNDVPQLPVRPVTTLKDPPGDQKIPLTQIAVNRRFLCYALRKGDIRAMDRIAGLRILIRQHSAAVSDMKFLSEEDDWLLTAGLDHKIVIQELKPDQTGIRHRILLQIQLQVPLPSPSDAPVRAIWAPRREKFIIFAVQSSVYLCSVERAFRGRHIRDASGYLSDLEWDSGAVVALKVGENNAAFGQLTTEGWEELTVLSGNDDEGLVAGGSKEGEVHLWNLEEHDLFAFLDQEESISPFLSFSPRAGQPVQYVGWCPTSGSSCLLTVSGERAFQGVYLYKYELNSPTASNQSHSPPIELQSLEIVRSTTGGDSQSRGIGYGTVLVAKEAELLLLADMTEPCIFIIHTLEDEPGRLMFESLAQFRVKQPILSMVMGGEDSSRLGEGGQFNMYCMQAEAVQQYTIDPVMCLPSYQGSDVTDRSGGSPCTQSQGDGLGNGNGEAESGLSGGVRGDKVEKGKNEGGEDVGAHWRDTCPSGEELRAVSASLPSLFGGRFAESAPNQGDMPMPMPPLAAAPPVARSLVSAGSVSSTQGGSARQDNNADVERNTPYGEPRPEAAVAAINRIRTSQMVQDGLPTSEKSGPIEEQSTTVASQPVAGVMPVPTSIDLTPMFQQMEADQKRNIQVLEHKLGRAFHSLNKKLDSGFDDRKARGVGGAEVMAKLEAQFQEFAGRAIGGMSNAIQKVVQDEVRVSVRNCINGALQKAVGEGLSRQVSSGLQRSVESVVLAQLPKTVNRALQDNFQESFHTSIIPAFESAVQNMFGQIQTVFTQGLAEHVNSAKDLNTSVKENVSTVTTLAESVHSELADMKAQMLELKHQMIDVQRGLAAVREVPPTPMSVRSAATSSHDMLMQEVASLLQQESYDDAFHKALSLSRVDVTNWLISKVDHNKLFAGNSPCPLRQEVLLSLLNQLGCDMMENTAVKLEWIKGVTAHVDPTPLSPRQSHLMRGMLDHLIKTIQTIIATHKLSGQMMVSAKMALNMLMGVKNQ